MRSADTLLRVTLLAAAAALAGCSTISDSMQTIQDNVVAPVSKAIASGAAAVTPAAAAAPASSASAPIGFPVAGPIRVERPVPPAAQRAFDDALRALRAGRTDDAERGFKALTLSHPDLGGPHANLGVIYRQRGKLPESAAALERAVKESPDQPLFHNQLGLTYRHLGQFTKARAAYERAIELDANYAAAHLNLGILHDLYLRDGARALESYERYMALSGGKDAAVAKWVTDLKNRKPAPNAAAKKEQS